MLPDYEKMGVFYLGKADDGVPFLYDARHLLTHGVVIGMTGSGKTGLSIGLLEEAAIDGIPAIVIDPKGDLSNLLLTFPQLRAEDFAPWVPEGKDPAEEAATWQQGLADWDQDGARIQRLRDAAEVSLYTPGSSSGISVSIVKSLDAPDAAVLDDPEALRERVVAVASSLLGLVGVEADPVKSREHVLLTSILYGQWSKGKSLDLETLIQRVQDPKVAKIGVLDLETFFPLKDRFELAAMFNNLLASPSFAAWLEGEALDVSAFLRTKAGKPRISIFSIAHLGDAERMFFVTLLLHQMVGWMRSQSGTTSLRALLYMDEIFGYFPPVANPPSKAPLLTLLKQARAFGLGVLLATQNPVDLDYKGLSNTGTWFIGRLQTDRDKARVVEGLAGAAGGQPVDRPALERLLSGLEKRQFLVHDVHEPRGPLLLRTRFTLSYLRGPMTREHIRALRPKAAASKVPKIEVEAEGAAARAGSPLPVLPREIVQVFLDPRTATLVPYLLGAATVSVSDAKAGLDVTRDVVFAAPFRSGPVPVVWDEAVWVDTKLAELSGDAPEGAEALADALPDAAQKPKTYATWAKDFAGWLAKNQGVSRLKSKSTGLVSEAGEDEAAFRARLSQAAREERDAALDGLKAKYAPKFEALRDKIRDEGLAAQEARAAADQASQANHFAVGAGLVGAIFGRGGVSSAARQVAAASRGSGRAAQKAQSAQRREANVAAAQEKWRALDAAFRADAAKIAGAYDPHQEPLEVVVVKPKKSGIDVKLVALAWRGKA